MYVRHGQSQANFRGVFAGGKDDTPLTDLGRAQAKELGDELRSENIDRIITSPLDRTLETAQIIAKEIGFDTDNIQLDERLREYELGLGSGEPIDGMIAKKIVSFSGAEDPKDFETRVRGALLDIKKLDGTTLVVAHGGVGRLIECMRAGNDPASFYDQPGFSNAHAVEINLDWLA